MSSRLAIAVAGGALAIWAGCTAFDGAELAVAPISDDGGASSSSSSSGCARATLPDRGDAAGTGGDIEVVVVIREIQFGIKDRKPARDVGYDLDGVCSCAEDKGSCAPRKEAADGGDVCDGELGRDDGTGALVASLLQLGLPDPSGFANESFASGERSILVRIKGYNGQKNDDDVNFALYRARVATKPPTFGPDEAWNVNEEDLKTGGTVDDPITSSPGFVRDNVLVVKDLVSSRIPFNGDSDLELVQVKFTGKLTETGGRWNLENAIGVGRWPLKDALRTVSRIRDPLNDDKTRLCENASLMELARQKICGAADIAVSPADDRQTPLRPCGALSAAVKFVTVPSALGTTYPTTPDNACQGLTIPSCD